MAQHVASMTPATRALEARAERVEAAVTSGWKYYLQLQELRRHKREAEAELSAEVALILG